MKITYVNPGLQAMIDSVMLFQTDHENSYWSDPVFYFYPSLDKALFQTLDLEGKKQYISESFEKIYHEQEDLLNQKVNEYNGHWAAHASQIEDALSDAFELDVRPLFNGLRGEICLNPVCPRFLQEEYFQVFYLNSKHGAIGISIHEIIHFLWFYVWNQEFHDEYAEYERPSLKWILSEMVVESIMGDERLSSINPYFPRENGGCVYGYFQNMKLGDKMALDVIEQLYQGSDIKTFMRESYAYCRKYEEEIRAHIHREEQKF